MATVSVAQHHGWTAEVAADLQLRWGALTAVQVGQLRLMVMEGKIVDMSAQEARRNLRMHAGGDGIVSATKRAETTWGRGPSSEPWLDDWRAVAEQKAETPQGEQAKSAIAAAEARAREEVQKRAGGASEVQGRVGDGGEGGIEPHAPSGRGVKPHEPGFYSIAWKDKEVDRQKRDFMGRLQAYRSIVEAREKIQN